MRRAPWPRTIPTRAFLIGSSFKPDAALPNFAVFDNYIQDASYLTGMIAGAMTKSRQHRHGRRLSDPRGQPADECLHGRREGDQAPTPSSRSPSSAPGSIRRRPRRRHSPRSMPAPTCCMPSASASPTRPRRRASWRSAMSSTRRPTIPRRSSPRRSGISSRRSITAIAQGEGRQLQGRRLRRLFLHEGRRLLAWRRSAPSKARCRPTSWPRSRSAKAHQERCFTTRSTTTSRSRPEHRSASAFSPCGRRRAPR